ncbi:MAG: fumarylacetoacetate hydrolase family protein, partial [Polyangiaceae bacterium]|nr:fumarylacetoacetate hydrolase family protein [Polyangiaceae bacterium]
MKLATYVQVSEARVGAVVGDCIVDMQAAALAQGRRLPAGMLPLLEAGYAALETARDVVERADLAAPYCLSLERVRLLAPIPRPPSVRDGYAFRRHVESSRRNRGLPMIEEFDRFPVFYFSNHHAVVGPGAVHVREAHLDRLDFELECAAVIGRGGRNIPCSRADQHIAG